MRCTLRSTGGLTATSTSVLDRHAHRLPYTAVADQQCADVSSDLGWHLLATAG